MSSARLRLRVIALVMPLAVSMLPSLSGPGTAADGDSTPTSGAEPTPDPTTPVAGCGTTVLKKPDGTAWECTFADNFSGTELDRSKWTPQRTAYTGFTTGAADCYVDSPGTVRVLDGKLRLTTRRLTAPQVCATPSGQFKARHVAGSVTTWDSFHQAYGRFEIRARMPNLSVPGFHSALWLYPRYKVYGAWPKSGEIDIAEFWTNQSERTFPVLHYATEEHWLKTIGSWCWHRRPDAFHTYRVVWTPDRMNFFVDGTRCWSATWSPAAPLKAPAPFDNAFLVALTQASGNGKNAATSQTPRAATLQVDYVRVWK